MVSIVAFQAVDPGSIPGQRIFCRFDFRFIPFIMSKGVDPGSIPGQHIFFAISITGSFCSHRRKSSVTTLPKVGSSDRGSLRKIPKGGQKHRCMGRHFCRGEGACSEQYSEGLKSQGGGGGTK